MAEKIEQIKEKILEELKDDDHCYFHVRGKLFVCATCEDMVEFIIKTTAKAILEDLENFIREWDEDILKNIEFLEKQNEDRLIVRSWGSLDMLYDLSDFVKKLKKEFRLESS